MIGAITFGQNVFGDSAIPGYASMKIRQRVLMVLLACAAASPAGATTKGLNQIVTPDLQPSGELSLSAQWQDRRIGDPRELQGELGLNRWLEVAVFQGLLPHEQIVGTEISLLQREPWLISVGAINWSTRGGGAQPFVEFGHYTEHDKLIAGVIRANERDEALLGWAHDFNDRWRIQFDYQSGQGNSVTAGFTCSVTSAFQFNPAIYLQNDAPHRVMGYLVFTYTLKAW
jgi:hypothetical protein